MLPLAFNGASDEAGNLYWVERPRTGSIPWLVSVSRDGVLRFRTPLPPPGFQPGFVMVGGGYVFVLDHLGRLEALSASDGSHLWGSKSSHVAAYDSRGRLYMRSDSGLEAVSADSGRLLWRYRPEHEAGRLLLDEAGNLFVFTSTRCEPSPCSSTLRVSSLTPEGQVRSTSTVPPAQGTLPYTVAPLFGGGLLGRNEAIQLAGPTRSSFDFTLTDRASPVLARTRGVGFECRFGSDSWEGTCASPWLIGFSWPDGRFRFTRELPVNVRVFDLNLTSSESVLFTTDGSAGIFLREFSLDGEERMRCPLPLASGSLRPDYFYSAQWTALTPLPGGRWVTFATGGRIVAFDVPGVELADEGWATHRGNPGRTGMPLSP
jgi:outer membrane protein assembly factor BamB